MTERKSRKQRLKERAIQLNKIAMGFNEIDQTTGELFAKLLKDGLLTEKGYQVAIEVLESCVDSMDGQRKVREFLTQG